MIAPAPRRTLPALAVFAALALTSSASASPKSTNCSSLVLGPAVFSKIKATGVSCRDAKRLIDKTTLEKNRKGATFWTYGGWNWTIAGVDETTSRLRGKRGARRISATWSVT